MDSKIKNIIVLIRPQQYVKNLFIFLPLFFAGEITNGKLLLNATIAFIAFSISASAVYILNDYKDIEDDKKHYRKKFRPLAAGLISKKSALTLMVVLLIIGAFIMATISLQALAILGIYVFLNIAYSFYLKHITIIDVMIISIGFILRISIGSNVTAISLSMWIIIMTFMLTLFLALAKRRDDVLLYINTTQKVRKSIDGYNLQFIDMSMVMMASVVIVTYIMYTVSIDTTQNNYLYTTTIFVILGIMRYLQISIVNKDSGSPTKIILKDKLMQAAILTWGLFFVLIIYI